MSSSTATFTGGFSFRDNVVGKPPSSSLAGLMLGDEWIWAEGGQPDHLLNALTVQGFAVTPAKWANGYKSKKKGHFLEASYLLLDFDANLSWEDAKKHPYFTQFAAFAYTSASHGRPGKGDRFRVVFALDCIVTDAQVFDRLIEGLAHECPGSDPAINAASLLYGNPGAEVHVFNLENRLPTKVVYYHWAIADAQKKLRSQSNTHWNQNHGGDDASYHRVNRWLAAIPNTSRDTWVRVCGCLRNIEGHGYEWAYSLFEEWSARDYVEFDPEACERLWESMDSNPGGFTKLKEYFVFFSENPDADEFSHGQQQGSLNTQSKIQRRVDTLNTLGESTHGNAYKL